MPTQYLHTTYAQAKAILAEHLADPDQVFYSNIELGLYIKEALRFWGSATGYWRETVKLDTVVGQAFYDIRDATDLAGTSTPLATEVMDRDILTDITFALMEPEITAWGGGWIGSEQFTLEELTTLLQQAVNNFLRETGSIAAAGSYPVNPGVNRVDLLSTVIQVLRASIREVGSIGQPLTLWPADQQSIETTTRSAWQPAVNRPKSYAITYNPNLSLDLWPAPQVNSTLAIHAVEAQAALTPGASATILSIPNDLTWALKYAVMADALSGDGLARAPQMAQYCTQRWQQAIGLMDSYQSILWADLAGRRVSPTSLAQLEIQRPGWNTSTGSPKSIHQLNWNLFAINPVPNSVSTIVLECVRRSPLPSIDTDFIQLGPEFMEALYDYAQHIAQFKLQGPEFASTMGLLENTIEAATDYVNSQGARSHYWLDQQKLKDRDRIARPYRKEPTS